MDEKLSDSQILIQTEEASDDVSPRFVRFQSFTLQGCCRRRCVAAFSFTRVSALQSTFSQMDAASKRKFVKEFFANQPFGPFGSLSFIVDGAKICRRLWMFIHNIKSSWYYECLKKSRSGNLTVERAASSRTLSLASAAARNWLAKHASDTGDRAPDEDKVYLSSCMSKKDVYELFKAEVTGRHVVPYTTFTRLWRKLFPHIRLRRHSKFAKCGVCVLLRDAYSRSSNSAFRKWLREKKTKHVEQQGLERAAYYRHRQKSENSPELYASLIIDGMDQKKTNIPHFKEESKSCRSEFFKLHLTGAICHGGGETFMYVDEMEYPHDSNHTMNVLLKTLQKISKNGRIPPVLYIQMDNCWRENKNKYVFGLCGMLVQRKICKKIRLSYLMVGHTHEDIDQRFSKVASRLRIRSAPTLDIMKEVIKESQKPTPEVDSLTCLYDLKEWLRPHLHPIKNHSKPHAFKFEADLTGAVLFRYKMWASDNQWRGPVRIFKSLPSEVPSISRPDFGRQISIEDANTLVTACGGLLTSEQASWWGAFLEKQTRKRLFWEQFDCNANRSSGKWLLDEFVLMPECEPRRALDENEVAQKYQVSKMIARQTSEAEIVVTR